MFWSPREGGRRSLSRDSRRWALPESSTCTNSGSIDKFEFKSIAVWLSFGPAAVGKQVTLDSSNNTDPGLLGVIESVRQQAAQGKVGLIARHNTVNGVRGYVLVGSGNLMQSDRVSESSNLNLLMAAASDTEELTVMAVPINSAIRLGIDTM